MADRHTVAWVSEPSGRGTLTLLASCAATTALCTWIVIHPRISTDKKKRLPHKLSLWLKTIIAPELLAIEALQEWMQARRLVRQCQSHTNKEFGMVQAFYIGMFGVQYYTTHGSRVMWPNQFAWLMKNRFFLWEERDEWGLTTELIQDKSNTDTMAKLLALTQVVWFVIQSILRWSHRLPLSPLETMTLGYIPLFAVTYFCWWEKPKDVATPSMVLLEQMDAKDEQTFLSMSIERKFDDEGTEEQCSMWNVWSLTPRVFEQEAREKSWQDQLAAFELSTARYERHVAMCSTAECQASPHRPPLAPVQKKEKTLAHWDPDVYHSRLLWSCCCAAGVSFPAFHLLSWNAIFPSLLESWLWRTSSIVSIVSMLGFMHFERIVLQWQDPLLVLKFSLPFLYLVTRLCLLVSAFIAFRAMDPAVYDTYAVN